MNIDEQDLFNFVNYPEKLEDAKKKYIEDNPELFIEAVNALKSAPEFDNTSLTGDLQFKMHLKMIGKKPKKTIDLIDASSTLIHSNQIRTLVADSGSINNSPKSKTFTDETGSYLIKVIYINDKADIYTFTSNNEELNNFSLYLNPPGEIHHIKSNKSPFVLKQSQVIENIRILFF